MPAMPTTGRDTTTTESASRAARRRALLTSLHQIFGVLETIEARIVALETQPKPKIAAPDVERFWIVGPDADRIFVDRAGRAHRVEDLEPDLRREVEAADEVVLPRNEDLAEASRLLYPHVRHLPKVEWIAIVVALARALVNLEVRTIIKTTAAVRREGHLAKETLTTNGARSRRHRAKEMSL